MQGARSSRGRAQISDMMSRKSISTGDPADKSDRDVLEAVIDMDDSSWPLPNGR